VAYSYCGNFSAAFPFQVPASISVWGFQMSSFPESLLDDMCNTRLVLIAEAACDFKAQLLDLMNLREQVRKAEFALDFRPLRRRGRSLPSV
jgi:hypothetical protein